MKEKIKKIFDAILEIVGLFLAGGFILGMIILGILAKEGIDGLIYWGKVFLVIVVILGVLSFTIWLIETITDTERWKRRVELQKRQKTIQRIRNLTKDSLPQGKTGFGEETLTIDKAIEQGVIRVVSLKGYGIYEAKVELECIKPPSDGDGVSILIPLGTVLVYLR